MFRNCTCLRAVLATLVLAGVLLNPLVARAEDAAREYVRYRVEIDAPKTLAALLESDLDLLRWQDFATMTADLLERLTVEARSEAREILAAQGYFSPAIETSTGVRDGLHVVRMAVQPGEQARVARVDIAFTGAISTGDALDRQAMARTRTDWSLPQGAAFTQAEWERAKQRIVRTISARRYAGARIASSEARVDPERNAVAISVTLDSGPVVRFGELDIFGLDKHDAARVRNLWTFAPDTEFDREILERFQRRLAALSYFGNAYVDADNARIANGGIPVRVSVVEAPTKSLDAGVRFSTDAGLGATFGYRHQNLFGRALRLRTRIELQQVSQLGEAIVDLPERPGGWADQLQSHLKHAEIENLRTDEWLLGWRRAAIEERRQPSWGVTFVQSRQEASLVLDESVHATLLYAGYTWRTTDSLLSPRRGLIAHVEAGVAPPGVSTRAFLRPVARLAWYRPLGPMRDLVLQAQAGAAIASASTGIPQYFLFRTGGSTSVRGYDPDSLGVRRGAAVLGGRYFALASAEVTHWFNDFLGAAAFIDAGNAADELRELRPAYGIGAGLRARTPLGPFRLDVAYGEAHRSLRVHFSIGLTF